MSLITYQVSQTGGQVSILLLFQQLCRARIILSQHRLGVGLIRGLGFVRGYQRFRLPLLLLQLVMFILVQMEGDLFLLDITMVQMCP